jgi:hypothetical protein
MTLAANEIQKTVYSRLTSQLTPVPIYDFVPQDSAYPFVVIGRVSSEQWGTTTKDGQQFTVQIHAFDKAAGKKSVQTILQNIYAALHQQESNLIMTGFTAITCNCAMSEAFQDPSPEGDSDHYFHGVQRYRIQVQN